jgi:hypothetical protein
MQQDAPVSTIKLLQHTDHRDEAHQTRGDIFAIGIIKAISLEVVLVKLNALIC